MNDLVRELQDEIKRLLLSDVIKNDRYAEKQEINQAIIIETWRTWAEEFFCDTVGFVIGGASFTSAFSMYLRMLGRSQYHVEKLAHRSHPVSWIRTQLLANRARQMGYNAVAAGLEDEWNQIASALGIVENYYGFYHPTFLSRIQQKLDDMLTETQPQRVSRIRSRGAGIGTKLYISCRPAKQRVAKVSEGSKHLSRLGGKGNIPLS